MAPTAEEFEMLLTQLKERMDRGQGETIYEIGVGGKCREWEGALDCSSSVNRSVLISRWTFSSLLGPV